LTSRNPRPDRARDVLIGDFRLEMKGRSSLPGDLTPAAALLDQE
jgi:hypothetical protein